MLDEHEWDPQLFATPAFLKRRFELLRASDCNLLPLGEGLERLKEGTLPPRSVAITFDDGFHDFAAQAMPLLEAFGFPATNYVSTYYCLNQRPIPGLALRYVLWRGRDRVLPPRTFPGQDRAVDLRNDGARMRLAAALLGPEVVAAGSVAQHERVGEVAAALGVDWEEIQRRRLFHLMRPEEVANVARRGVDIQLHTHRHRTPMDRDLFIAEVELNRSILSSMTGSPAVHFCYPSGVVEPEFLPWLRQAHVASATTGAGGLASGADDPLLLPRFVDTMAQPESQFSAWLCGAGSILSRRRVLHPD